MVIKRWSYSNQKIIYWRLESLIIFQKVVNLIESNIYYLIKKLLIIVNIYAKIST